MNLSDRCASTGTKGSVASRFSRLTRELLNQVAALCVIFVTASAFAAPPVPELLHYRFDQSGTSVTNLASSPPAGTATGTIGGGLTQNVTLNPALKALQGSGVSSSTDFVNTGWATSLGSGSWSISFFSSGISNNSTLYYIMGDSSANSFRIFTNGVAGSNNWILRGTGITDSYVNGGALSTLTMTTFVYDSTNATPQIRTYLNGVLQGTYNQTASTVNVTGAGPFKVMGYSSNVGAPAGGLLADVRIYNRAISQAEITEIYQAGTGIPQTLTFGPAPTVVVGGTGNVNATSASPNSGNPITYSTTSTDCSVTSAGVVTGINAGSNNCVITATQAGDLTYLAGTASQTFSIGQAAQTLTFPPQTTASRPFVLNSTFAIDPVATSASPNSGNAITYSSLTAAVCSVSGTTVTMLQAGTCTIAADQAGNSNFTAASQVSQSVVFGQAIQTLTFPPQTTASRPFVLNATFAIDPLATSASPNSGNAITYSSLTAAICSVSGSTVTMLQAGTCTIAADQAGNTNFAAATQVTQSVALLGPVTVGGNVTGLAGSGLVLSLNGGSQTLAIAANGAFTFPTAIAQNTSYNVTVQTQPSGPTQTCTVTNGSGTTGSSNVNNVSVSCATNAFPVSINLPAGVSATPSGTQTVTAGATIAFTLSAASGFRITGAFGCGGTLVGNVFTTGPITANCTITVFSEAVAVAVPTANSWTLLALVVSLLIGGIGTMRRSSRALRP